VWDAYRARRPIRVPLVLGINVRYTMRRPEANPTGIGFPAYFGDARVQVRRQCEHNHWVRHWLNHDQEMGLPEAWSVGVDFQNVYEAAWLGCELEYRGDEVPDTTPLLADEDRKRLLFDRGLPDPFSGPLMAQGWDHYATMRSLVDAGWEYQGRPLKHVWMTGLGTDGPVTVACNVRGATEFLTDLLADPDYAQELLTYLTDGIIARITAYRQHLGQPLRTAGWGFADDSIALLSEAQYRDFVEPHHRRLIEAFSDGTGQNSVHLCGDATHLFGHLRDALNIGSFDTGYPVDHGRLRAELGPEVEIAGGPSVPFLVTHRPDEVENECRRILESGIMAGGRFMLREGNNLPPECPPENVWAMARAVRKYGRY
ncbi:MAG: hypothetical protein HZB16_24930, partial [Armatimonadetes bacterium]|nr:hypothetical protein [Armatimonadota bacterium]